MKEVTVRRLRTEFTAFFFAQANAIITLYVWTLFIDQFPSDCYYGEYPPRERRKAGLRHIKN